MTEPRKLAGRPDVSFDSAEAAFAIGAEIEAEATRRHAPAPEPEVFAEIAEWQAWVDAGQPPEGQPLVALQIAAYLNEHWDPGGLLIVDPAAGSVQLVDLEAAAAAVRDAFRNWWAGMTTALQPVVDAAKAVQTGIERPAAPVDHLAAVRARHDRSKGPQQRLRPPRELGRQRGKGAWR